MCDLNKLTIFFIRYLSNVFHIIQWVLSTCYSHCLIDWFRVPNLTSLWEAHSGGIYAITCWIVLCGQSSTLPAGGAHCGQSSTLPAGGTLCRQSSPLPAGGALCGQSSPLPAGGALRGAVLVVGTHGLCVAIRAATEQRALRDERKVNMKNTRNWQENLIIKFCSKFY